MGWQAAFLVVGALAAAALVALAYGRWHWRSGTRALRGRLEAARIAIEPRVFAATELEELPAPVQRYFRAVLREGQPIVAAASLEHSGTFNTDETGAAWKPFKSRQRVVTRRPGFDWDARIAMVPGLTVLVHDAYVAGEGLLRARILGLLPLAEERATPAVAQGELMRFLAEAPWYPTALLPSQGVRWEAIDERSARATLVDGAVTVTLRFDFGADGLIASVSAPARPRTVSGVTVPTPWRARVWNYAERNGMRVPLEGEVSWQLAQGAAPYWRGRMTAVTYELAG